MARTALVVGESLVDVIGGAAGSISEHPGGSPANVAVALARLERPTALATRFANDRLGAILAAHLARAGVIVLPSSTRGTARTSSATAQLDSTGAATYCFDIDWDAELYDAPVDALVVHTGSIAAVLEPGASAVLDLLHRCRPVSTITYDVNARPAVIHDPNGVRSHIERLVSLSDVVKASDEDLDWLYPRRSVEDSARAWASRADVAVVVTRGESGATCFTSRGEAWSPGVAATVVDTIGAGDTFCAAMLDALWTRGLLGSHARPVLHTLPMAGWREVLAFASCAASVTVSRPGADPPYRDEIQAAPAPPR